MSLYASNEQLEKIKNIIPFTTAPKRIKYLGTHLKKYVQGLHADEQQQNVNDKNQEKLNEKM